MTQDPGAGPPAPWDLCLLRPLALALWPRALKGFPEPRPCPLTDGPEGQRRPGVGVPKAPLGSGDGEPRGKVRALRQSWVGGIMGYPGLRSAAAPVGLKWPLGRSFSSFLLSLGVKQ